MESVPEIQQKGWNKGEWEPDHEGLRGAGNWCEEDVVLFLVGTPTVSWVRMELSMSWRRDCGETVGS